MKKNELSQKTSFLYKQQFGAPILNYCQKHKDLVGRNTLPQTHGNNFWEAIAK